MLTNLAVQGELPDPSIVGPGMLGFVVFLGLLVAAIFLFRSLNKQIKRVDFDESADDSAQSSDPNRQTMP